MTDFAEAKPRNVVTWALIIGNTATVCVISLTFRVSDVRSAHEVITLSRENSHTEKTSEGRKGFSLQVRPTLAPQTDTLF